MRIIETDRLILRHSTENEWETIYEILVQELEGEAFTRDDFNNEIQFDRYLMQQPLGQSFGRPNIFLKADNRYIGYCSLMPRLCTPDELTLYTALKPALPHAHTLEAEVGWAISDRYRANGYATEASRALLDYGFRSLHVPRIVAFTTSDNGPSMRVMEKLGMRLGYHPHTSTVVGLIENDQL